MNKVVVKIQLDKGAVVPVYSSSQAAGADICACLVNGPMVIKPHCWAMVPTGLRFSIPEGYEIQVRPRSGLAAKKGITVLNAPGTIDSDYRGEVKVILINHSNEDFEINHGDRIAQMVLSSHCVSDFNVVTSLDETTRGEGGFGSTGI